MPFKTIIQPVVVSTDEYNTNHETFFTPVELQLPAQSVRVVCGFFLINESGHTLDSDEFAIHFYQKNTHAPGALNELYGLDAAQREANGYMCSIQISNSEADATNASRIGFSAPQMYQLGRIDEQAIGGQESPHLEDITITSINDGHTVFMHGTTDGISGSPGPTFSDANGCRVILTVEY